MNAAVAAAMLLALSSTAFAQAPTYDQFKSRNPVRLSAADLQQLIPDAKVISRTAGGTTRS
jgi:hypothetical protein